MNADADEVQRLYNEVVRTGIDWYRSIPCLEHLSRTDGKAYQMARERSQDLLQAHGLAQRAMVSFMEKTAADEIDANYGIDKYGVVPEWMKLGFFSNF